MGSGRYQAPAGSRYLFGGRTESFVELAGLAWAPIAAAAARVSGTPPLFTSYTLRTISDNRRVSWARATRDLGYAPRRLEETVRNTCRWFEENGLLEDVTVG